MPGTLDFRILGPLEARLDGTPLQLGGRKQRSLLALLLLERDGVVPTDRLVDELWDESPPETAQTALHGYVSALRKLLEPGRPAGAAPEVLVTRPPGYALRVADGALDLDRFERLLSEGREELARGAAASAAERLRQALALWRGPPLADLAGERFAERAARELEERWATAVEDRFAAELACGRHREFLPELEALVRRQPLRERLREQLMLALYRSGRQADALAAFADARRTLVEQLGIEPGSALQRLHAAILRHDPSLEAPAPPAADDTTQRRPRRRTLGSLAAAAALALVAVLAVAALRTDGERSPAHRPVRTNALLRLAPASGAVAGAVPVGSHPTSVVSGEGYVWALNARDRTITRVDPRSGATKTFAPGVAPGELAAGAGALWVMDRLGTSVTRIDPRSLAANPPIPLPGRVSAVALGGVTAGGSVMAVGGGSLWVVNADLSVSRLDPGAGRVRSVLPDVGANTIAYGLGALWVATLDGRVLRIDPHTARVTRRIAVASSSLAGIVAGGGAVWVADPLDGTLWRIDPGPPRVVMRTVPVGFGAAAVAYGDGAAWVANGLAGTITRVDAENFAPRTRRAPAQPLNLVATPRAVWVSVGAAPARAAPAGESVQPVRGAACGRLVYRGPGRPDALLVSDLPLQGGSRKQALGVDWTIRTVLAAHGFRAGRHRVAYQSCDDSTAQARGYEVETCIRNARAYAADPSVVAVLGAYNSGCSELEIPIANGARGGPLALVSPSNSDTGLTRPTPALPGTHLRALYPTGARSFARVYPPDATEAAADVRVARSLGVRRVFVLRDLVGGSFALDLAAQFRRNARRARVSIVGEAGWDAGAPGYDRLARRVLRSGADAVYIAGSSHNNGGALLHDLHAAAPRLRVVGPSAFISVPDLVAAVGPRAPWLRLTTPGLPTEQLPPAGRAFLRLLSRQRPGGLPPDLYWPPYAAQATEAVLAAIARSDGSRASVVQALPSLTLATAFGAVAFDGRGDPPQAAYTVLVLAPGGAGMSRLGADFADGMRPVRTLRVATPAP